MSEVIFKKSYPNGKVTYDKQTGNAIFTPNKVTSDTPVYIYYTGAIGNSNYYPGYEAAPEAIAKKYFENPNFNGIVIINNYEDDYVYSDSYVKNSVKDNRRIVEGIENQYGVSLNNRNVFGSSIGDRFALHDFVSEVRNGTDSGFCVITGASKINVKQGFNYNNQINSGTEDPNRAFLSEEDYQALKGKTVFTFESANGHNYTYVNALADHDVNVFLVECSDGGHNSLSLKPLQDNVFAFLAGDETAIDNFIKNGNYHFKKCIDAKNNTWVDATNEEVKEALITSVLSSEYSIKHNLGGLGSKIQNLKAALPKNLEKQEIKSDADFVSSAVNNILAAISSSNILSTTTSVNCESTTKVPPCEIDLLYDYTDSVIDLFDKLKTECQAAATISEHLNDTDWLLKHEAEMAFNKKDEVPADNANSQSTYNGANTNNNSSNKAGTNNTPAATTSTNSTAAPEQSTTPAATPVTETPVASEPAPASSGVTTLEATPTEAIVGPAETNEPVEDNLEEELDALEDLVNENNDDYTDDIIEPIMPIDDTTEVEVPEVEDISEETTTQTSSNKTGKNIGLALGLAAAAGAAGYGAYKEIKKRKEENDDTEENLPTDDEV